MTVVRSLTEFDCAGEVLAGTLDLPRAPDDAEEAQAGPRILRGDEAEPSGLLIVSAGNEIRTGAHRGMAMLAARIAAAGYPVFRYDRRGIGDSSGENLGFEQSGPDIAAAVLHLREHLPQLTRIAAFGIRDAATALAFCYAQAGIEALVLANPWLSEASDEDQDDPPPPAARSATKLTDPRELLRLVSGGVDLGKVARGLKRARGTPGGELAIRLGKALADAPATILTTRGDNSAIAFRAALPEVPVIERDTDSPSFAGRGDADWLCERIIATLRKS